MPTSTSNSQKPTLHQCTQLLLQPTNLRLPLPKLTALALQSRSCQTVFPQCCHLASPAQSLHGIPYSVPQLQCSSILQSLTACPLRIKPVVANRPKSHIIWDSSPAFASKYSRRLRAGSMVLMAAPFRLGVRLVYSNSPALSSSQNWQTLGMPRPNKAEFRSCPSIFQSAQARRLFWADLDALRIKSCRFAAHGAKVRRRLLVRPGCGLSELQIRLVGCQGLIVLSLCVREPSGCLHCGQDRALLCRRYRCCCMCFGRGGLGRFCRAFIGVGVGRLVCGVVG